MLASNITHFLFYYLYYLFIIYITSAETKQFYIMFRKEAFISYLHQLCSI